MLRLARGAQGRRLGQRCGIQSFLVTPCVFGSKSTPLSGPHSLTPASCYVCSPVGRGHLIDALACMCRGWTGELVQG